MAETQKVYYEVLCHNNSNHVIEKCFEIIKGSEAIDTKAEVFCPDCDNFVSFTVKGKLPIKKEVMRILKNHNL